MQKEKYFSETVFVITNKLTALGGLMMGLDKGAIEMKPDEVNALGFLVNDLGRELGDWNIEDPNNQPEEKTENKDWKVIQCADLVPEIKRKVKILASTFFDKSLVADAAYNVDQEDCLGFHAVLGEVYEELSKMDKLLNGN